MAKNGIQLFIRQTCTATLKGYDTICFDLDNGKTSSHKTRIIMIIHLRQRWGVSSEFHPRLFYHVRHTFLRRCFTFFEVSFYPPLLKPPCRGWSITKLADRHLEGWGIPRYPFHSRNWRPLRSRARAPKILSACEVCCEIAILDGLMEWWFTS